MSEESKHPQDNQPKRPEKKPNVRNAKGNKGAKKKAPKNNDPNNKDPNGNDPNNNANAPEPVKLMIRVKKYYPVYLFRPKNDVVNCTICRNDLDTVCAECQRKGITDQQACGFVTGVCGHRFHIHCIRGWLRDHNTCPFPGCDIWRQADNT